ncbi:MAG: protein usg [Caulobacteraceae bacterium]
MDREFAVQLTGRRLTTAEVLYYMPAHPALLQSFLWQTQDVAPDFPRIHRFLEFWRREIDAVIHSVTIGGVELIAPAKVRNVQYLGHLH